MKAPTTLCPGYKHVEAFGPDEEYESEEEVCYVTLDLGEIEPTLLPSSSSYRLIGLDTPHPFLQLQGTIFKGRHDSLLGTEMIFTDDKESHDWNKRSVVHVANTDQRIAFKEVTLIPKSASSKGKERVEGSEGEITVNFEPTSQLQGESMIDRMTGLYQPPKRPPRKKGGSTGKSTKGKGREASETTTTKGKGKEREKEKEQLSQDEVMQEPAPPEEGYDSMEDMYL